MEPVEPTENPGPTVAAEGDALLQWEIMVARRADELAPRIVRGREEDLRYWLQAEQDVWLNVGAALNRVSNLPEAG